MHYNFSKFILCIIVLFCYSVSAESKFITIASTTSTENSGLYDYLVPIYKSHSGVDIKVISTGTGNAIEIAKNGDADILLVHHKVSEEQFVNEGHGVKRHELMYNDFVIIGPRKKANDTKTLNSASEVFQKIYNSNDLFISRADNSGTHKKEVELWQQLKDDKLIQHIPIPKSNQWFLESGRGMGASLNMASQMSAFILSDRATWLNFNNKQSLQILFENDIELRNHYGITLVNPNKHAHVKTTLSQAFIDWVLSESGQNAINSYRINEQQAFFGNAK